MPLPASVLVPDFLSAAPVKYQIQHISSEASQGALEPQRKEGREDESAGWQE